MNNTLNTTELATGKDGRLYVELDDENVFLAEVDTFKVTMNFESTDVQPVGSIWKSAVPTGATGELSFTEMIIRDDVILEPLLTAVSNGYFPVYTFSGVIEKPDKSDTQRIVYSNAMPVGTFDLQNLTPGEVVKAERTFRLNSIPKLQDKMASTYLS